MRLPMSTPQFISDAIEPVAATFDATAMARGEAGLPGEFAWRGRRYRVVEVEEAWVTSSPEGGSGEMYLRRHWWRVRTIRLDSPTMAAGPIMTIYFERQARRGGGGHAAKARWWLYTIEEAG
ncbi:MAG: DUF6504 family protein [Phycisphaeraceae bacterium]